MPVPPMAAPGWMRQTATEQEFELNYGGLVFLGEPRNVIVRMLLQRPLP